MPDSASDFNPPSMRSNFAEAADEFRRMVAATYSTGYARHASSTRFYFPRTDISSMAPECGVPAASDGKSVS